MNVKTPLSLPHYERASRVLARPGSAAWRKPEPAEDSRLAQQAEEEVRGLKSPTTREAERSNKNAMMNRAKGAMLPEIAEATGGQEHLDCRGRPFSRPFPTKDQCVDSVPP